MRRCIFGVMSDSNTKARAAEGRVRRRLAILLSGSGTTLENLFDHIEQGKLAADVDVVISSRADAFGLERARSRDVPTVIFKRRDFATDKAYSAAIFGEVDKHDADLVVLCGFVHLLRIPDAYQGRVVNIHPALIPSFCGQDFYGRRVYEAVLAAGVKLTGCTVHFCDDEYDQGPIIMQQAVEVRNDDTPETLAARVQAAERELYPRALQLIIDGRVRCENGRAYIDDLG